MPESGKADLTDNTHNTTMTKKIKESKTFKTPWEISTSKNIPQTNAELFSSSSEFIYLEKIIGSGLESEVAKLAIEDGIAYRAARKNMQIHSAIVLKVDGKFAGFFTFQNNHDIKEFCLLQSTIKPEFFNFDLYSEMVGKVIEQNTQGYPAFITTDPKSKFETPKLFESLGFVTYLEMSGFCYMIFGKIEDSRFKFLAHITMCNVWNSISGRWLKVKREWNEKIESAGEKHGIKTNINPLDKVIFIDDGVEYTQLKLCKKYGWTSQALISWRHNRPGLTLQEAFEAYKKHKGVV